MSLKTFCTVCILPALIIIGLYFIDPQLVEPYITLIKIIAGILIPAIIPSFPSNKRDRC